MFALTACTSAEKLQEPHPVYTSNQPLLPDKPPLDLVTTSLPAPALLCPAPHLSQPHSNCLLVTVVFSVTTEQRPTFRRTAF